MLRNQRHPSSQRFHDILKELGDLHDKKQASYGTESDPFNNYRATAREWGLPDWVMVMLRAAEKVKRLAALRLGSSLRDTESPTDGEGIAETLDDIAVLAVIARVMYEEGETISEETDCVCGGAPNMILCGPRCNYPYTDA